MENLIDEMELSKRYLVSGMFAESSRISERILESVLSKSVSSGPSSSEITDCNDFSEEEKNLISCSGSILVQSYHKLEKHEELLQIMENYFSTFSDIPSDLLYLWVSTQLVSKNFPLAERTLNRYFSSMPGTQTSSSESNQSSNLARIYTFDILTLGIENAEKALNWIEFQQQFLTAEQKTELISLIKAKMEERNGGKLLPNAGNKLVKVEEPPAQNLVPTETEADQSVISSILKGKSSIFKLLLAFNLVEGYKNGSWQKFFSRNRDVLCAIFVGIIVSFFFVKKRSLLHRWRRTLTNEFVEGLREVWKLAFSGHVAIPRSSFA